MKPARVKISDEEKLRRHKALQRKWYEANKSKVLEKVKASKARRKEQGSQPRARTKVSLEERVERQRRHQRKWYEANKEQVKAAAKTWLKKNQSKAIAYAREYRERNKERIALRHRQKKYGVTLDFQLGLLEAQGYACAICGWSFPSLIKANLDHDHTTGAVRGFLCGPCNRGLGSMRDSPEVLRAAATYLETRK